MLNAECRMHVCAACIRMNVNVNCTVAFVLSVFVMQLCSFFLLLMYSSVRYVPLKQNTCDCRLPMCHDLFQYRVRIYQVQRHTDTHAMPFFKKVAWKMLECIQSALLCSEQLNAKNTWTGRSTIQFVIYVYMVWIVCEASMVVYLRI